MPASRRRRSYIVCMTSLTRRRSRTSATLSATSAIRWVRQAMERRSRKSSTASSRQLRIRLSTMPSSCSHCAQWQRLVTTPKTLATTDLYSNITLTSHHLSVVIRICLYTDFSLSILRMARLLSRIHTTSFASMLQSARS